MSETSTRTPGAAEMTPGIAPEWLKEREDETADHARYAETADHAHYAEADELHPSEEFVVRLRRNQDSVAFRLNTRRLVERREIERANEMIRRSGR